MIIWLNLQKFAGEEIPAAGSPETAETAPAAETTESVTMNAGDTLADGTQISSKVAAAMNEQMKRHPELQSVYGQGRKQKAGTPANPAGAQTAEKTPEQRWEELKKGEFAELYGRDVQSAIQDRFKNAKEQTDALNKLEPMLKVLRERAGVESNEDLMKQVLDDDSLYEDAAAEADMPVAAYKQFKQMEQQLQEAQAREQQSIQAQMINNHLMKLSQQAEEFKQMFPDFDLNRALEDPTFFKLTTPEVGLSVRDAYFAIHHDELAPQMMAYGMQRARNQMGQTIAAQGRRPAEGAMKATGQKAADVNVDIRQLQKSDRKKIYDLIHKGKMTWG